MSPGLCYRGTGNLRQHTLHARFILQMAKENSIKNKKTHQKIGLTHLNIEATWMREICEKQFIVCSGFVVRFVVMGGW